MSEPRTIKQLMMDMGISREKEESLKKDILASLGSPDTASKLSPAEIQNLSLNFINSAKGAEYFARHGSEGEWGHEKSRVEVENSFPDLVRRIQTNKRKNLGKRPAANPGISNKLNTSANVPAIVEGTVPGRTTVNQQDASAHADGSGQTVENSEEDHNGEQRKRVGDIWEIQSLPDVEHLVGRRQRRPVPSETYDFSDASLEPDVPTCQAGPQHQSRIAHNVAQPPLQGLAQAALPTPPLTGRKRRFDSNNAVHGIERQAAFQGSPQSKRPRWDADERRRRESTVDSQEGNGWNDAVSAGSRNTDWHVPAWHSRPSPEIAVDVVSAFETRETLPTVYTCLASSIALSKQLAFTVDALSSLPALVLDYLRQCEQSSLGRIKSIVTTPETRQIYFQKNKILRDLYADVESRILNLAGQRAEQLASRDGRDGSVEVSSHVLWDLEAPI